MLDALANCFLILSMIFLEVAKTLNISICYVKTAAARRLFYSGIQVCARERLSVKEKVESIDETQLQL